MKCFFILFWQSVFFCFMQSRLCFFAPFSSLGTSALALFSAKGFGNLCFFSAGIYFYWMKLGHNRESKVSSPLAYTDCPEGGTCVFCTRAPVGICQSTRRLPQNSPKRVMGIHTSKPFLHHATLPAWFSYDSNRTFCNNPNVPYVNRPSQRLLSSQNGRWVFKAEAAALSSLKPETPLSSLHPSVSSSQ